MTFVSESEVYLQERCRLKLFLPYGPMLLNKISKKKMLWGYGGKVPSKTLCSNPLDGFRENGFTDDDGRHTMDARARGVALLCSSTKQS